ncbi:uncharacterized protein LOC130367072 [Hyla sarda]|uniref:uncharacterized protein LOC130367072 n=1 Tax=Hyla sarda TaxID=327740 RepID=UPI0024C2A07A|nr:uncharacterized protein LOC130367072 [Hyla sarda]
MEHKKTNEQVRCILEYNSRSTQVAEILQRHWSILLTDSSLCDALPPLPSITYRRSRNIKDTLVHSHYTEGDKKGYLFGGKGPRSGNTPCGKCVACPNMEKTTSFNDATGTRTYKIHHLITCTTKGVIYAATCPCNLTYIGMTTREFRRRIREHVLDIQAAKNETDIVQLKSIPRHFREKHECNSSLLRFRGIDHVTIGPRQGNWPRILAQHETRWIFRLGTMAPQGLNEVLLPYGNSPCSHEAM